MSGPNTVRAQPSRTRPKRLATQLEVADGASTQELCRRGPTASSSGSSQISKVESPTARRSSARSSRQATVGSTCADSDKQPLAGRRREKCEGGRPRTPGAANIPAATRRDRTASGALTQSARKSAGRSEPAGRVGSARAAAQSGSAAIAAAYTGLSPALRVVSHETHLSAEEAQARPYARLSRPHANPRRPPHAQAPARQRSQAPDGLMVGVPGGSSAGRAGEAVAQRRFRPGVPPRALPRRARARAVRVSARGGR